MLSNTIFKRLLLALGAVFILCILLFCSAAFYFSDLYCCFYPPLKLRGDERAIFLAHDHRRYNYTRDVFRIKRDELIRRLGSPDNIDNKNVLVYAAVSSLPNAQNLTWKEIFILRADGHAFVFDDNGKCVLSLKHFDYVSDPIQSVEHWILNSIRTDN